ncbi:VOC family protein [Microbulbifer variabilis]|uniref:VOC family protein n=1 Tax=Microbulbifer variabilis TaxID=266805 RepID=UPI0039A68054
MFERGELAIKPFHLSFVVPDLKKAREFYVNLLGCAVGRDTGEWIDVIFYGHQITIHQERDGIVAKPIDHFGPLLEKEQWGEVLALLKANSIPFVLEPLVKGENSENEAGKFVVKDPEGNLLEFKYYNNFADTVVSKNT